MTSQRTQIAARFILTKILTIFAATVLTTAMTAAMSAGTATAQTPEQRYLEWATPSLDARTYAARRNRLLEELGSGVMLIPAHHGVSDGTSFRQLDDFWHLTGLELPSSMLVLDADAETVLVFVPARDSRFESASRPNDFPGRPLLGDESLWETAGLTPTGGIGAIDAYIESLATTGRTVRVNTGRRGPVTRPPSGYYMDWSASDGLVHHLAETWPGLDVSNAYEAVARVRMIKDAAEIEAVRRVVSATVDAIRHAAGFVRPGVSERDLEAELEAQYKRRGAQRLAFASIIKSGPNSLWPWRILAAHYDRRNRRMVDGELVIFDVGTEMDGYVSDVGRTFPVSGRFTDRQREILEMETAVADAIIGAIRPGVTLAELTELAYQNIPEAHRSYMQTGVFFGHFIGMSTGDPALYDIPLAEGMVITVEPWYYNHDEGISVFTEDVILVTKDGAENLSAGLQRSASELEALVNTANQ